MLCRAFVPTRKGLGWLLRRPLTVPTGPPRLFRQSWARSCASHLQSVAEVQTPLHEYHFEVKEIEGKGLGAFATKDFEPGDLVLAEYPIIPVRTNEGGDAWNEELHRQYDQLTPEAKAEVFKLHDTCIQKPEKSLEGILFTNCISRDSGARFDVALCLLVSRFNHSCSPNLEQSWDEGTGQAYLVAAEPIKAGDELFTYYVDLRLDQKERRQRLRESYGFESTEHYPPESDQRRTEMKSLDDQIIRVQMNNPEKGLRLVKKLMKLYDEEGLHMYSWRKRNCLHAVQFCLKRRDTAGAMRWAKKGLRFSRLAHGDAHADTKTLLQLSKDPSTHPAFESRVEDIRMVSNYVICASIAFVAWTVYTYQ
mmetsp:Transcript_84498/g.149561  ORF Transcript_84498/g.149561 Transcript_84498/m.149561 type:complete len:365 (-) Transcript_84498:69-1163(-)